ncbi:SDR family NAD(P)-dependent oxidoreductase [Leucobacter rhizosphaerae]|uniref:SDR family NAD(P)-dependent oxidoreductase n=1 Tax=Leucobacter rhizosphaerae TaxID=2932245 RepID=A0ABY4FSP8_9MICO|nr:SDR family NAD(P)-dependent oxidoreductase [Leucobacter rhizosphaerae]UOQ59328.1 SDR family NAD(P)-dependent oxidoreductase [Leucobacter rhizosphaerae]
MELHGTAAVVTGAASGLGAAVVAALVDRGAHVLGIDLSDAVDAVRDPRAGVTTVAADVTSADDVADALAALDPERPLRTVVNCAGIAPARRILSSRGVHDLELFRRVVDVNLTGTFNVLRLVSEVMAETAPVDHDGQRGVIVNTASIAAFEGQIGQAAYAASKGGIVALTLAAARDLARAGIRVNTIAPGIVNTPLLASLGPEVAGTLGAEVPFPARAATPEEFARLVLMIAEHDYLNGETIRMDGALRLGP